MVPSEQAEIPQIARRGGKRRLARCPHCSKSCVGFGDAYPPWCLCGWNVVEARQALRRWRVGLFCYTLLPLVLSWVFASLLGFLPLEGKEAAYLHTFLASIVIIVPTGVATWRTRWQAKALRHARSTLRLEEIAWKGPPAGWQPPEAELRLPPPRPVESIHPRYAHIAGLGTFVVMAVILVWVARKQNLGTPAILGYLVALSLLGVFLLHRAGHDRRLVREGRATQAIVIRRRRSADVPALDMPPMPEYEFVYLFVDVSGRRHKGKCHLERAAVEDAEKEKPEGGISRPVIEGSSFTVLYLPSNPKVNQPYCLASYRAVLRPGTK